jgi:UDP-N-acetyl-D-mannosaminuronate dehydrogenase
MTAVQEAADELTPGIKVGRYVVLERREITGATEIHIDPMPR